MNQERMTEIYESKIQELITERDFYAHDSEAKEQAINTMQRENIESEKQKALEHEEQIGLLKKENADFLA